jgi:hypothetical protein
MGKAKINLKLDGQGISVEKEIDEEQLVEIMSLIFSSNTVDSTNGKKSKKEKKSETRLTSISEFISSVDVNKNSERIAAIVLYHADILDESSIEKEDIPSWFTKAGLSAPKNLPRDIKTAIKENLIAEVHDKKGVYYITNTGKDKLKIKENQ